MTKTSVFNPITEATYLQKISHGLMLFSPTAYPLSTPNPNLLPASDASTHFHDRLEIRLLFGYRNTGQVDYQDIREILLTPPQALHAALPIKDIFAHITIRLDEISLYYLRGREMSVTMPWGRQSEALGLHIPAFLTACQNFYHGEVVSKAHMRQLLQLLLSTLEQLFQSPNTRWGSTPAENIACYLQEHYYRSDLTIREVTRIMHCSPNYVQKIFRRRYNCTPIEYLIEIRLETARKMLLTRRYRVKEVASLCGWNYVHYFDRRYRERFGHLPSEEWPQGP